MPPKKKSTKATERSKSKGISKKKKQWPVINRHGVHISRVSRVHAAYTPQSHIPADELTRELVAKWHDDMEEATPNKEMAKLMLDSVMAGCWLANTLRQRGIAEATIRQIQFNLGRQAFVNQSACWKSAVDVVHQYDK